MLNTEDVLKVAELAKLNINTTEIDKYKEELNTILKEVNKINDMDIDSSDILISPTSNKDKYFEDEVGKMLTIDDIKKNTTSVSGNFLSVVRVINE